MQPSCGHGQVQTTGQRFLPRNMLLNRSSAGENFTIQVFLSGDYEFLCYMYGLSGATGTYSQTSLEIKFEKCSSGRHRCLWCLIASNSLITPRQQHGRHTPRTLQGIQADYARFFASGGELKNAKHYNTIGSHFLDIDLDQVYMITTY